MDLLLGLSGILEDEVQLLTWLQVGVNMLQLLLLTALDFWTAQMFFWSVGFFSPCNGDHAASLCPGASGGIG